MPVSNLYPEIMKCKLIRSLAEHKVRLKIDVNELSRKARQIHNRKWCSKSIPKTDLYVDSGVSTRWVCVKVNFIFRTVNDRAALCQQCKIWFFFILRSCSIQNKFHTVSLNFLWVYIAFFCSFRNLNGNKLYINCTDWLWFRYSVSKLLQHKITPSAWEINVEWETGNNSNRIFCLVSWFKVWMVCRLTLSSRSWYFIGNSHCPCKWGGFLLLVISGEGNTNSVGFLTIPACQFNCEHYLGNIL